MPPELPAKKKLNFKKIIIIILIILAFFVISIGTALLIKNFTSKKDEKDTSTNSASNIINNYITSGKITSLSENNYQKHQNLATTINYKLAGRDYGVTVVTDYAWMFQSNKNESEDDSADVLAQTTDFMSTQGLKIVNKSSPNNNNGFQSDIYYNDSIVCQLTNHQPTIIVGISRYHTIACVDMTKIIEEYNEVEKLLTIYKKSNELNAFSNVSRTISTKENVSYSIIYLTANNSNPRLLFAAVDNNWDYISDLSVGDPQYQNGAYIITPETKSKISDSKYKGFLEEGLHS